VIRILRSFIHFWYDFIVGDDPVIAIGVIVALGLTALLAHADITSWWLLPVATAILLVASLIRAARATRPD
jgi:uncharacterized membrane protein